MGVNEMNKYSMGSIDIKENSIERRLLKISKVLGVYRIGKIHE